MRVELVRGPTDRAVPRIRSRIVDSAAARILSRTLVAPLTAKAELMDSPQRRVLVVDDDEAIREVARAALELVGGWQVTTADSGQDAYAIALAIEPDAMLLDVMMPGHDGPATVASMRADPVTRDIPVIFLTAKNPSGGAQAWREIGLAGVIPKPFDPMTLATEIARLLGWQG